MLASMTHKILVPVDLKDDHPQQLDFAVRLARAFDGEILLQHVVDYVPTMFPVEMPPGYEMPQLEFVRTSVVKKLDEMAALVQDVPVTTTADVGVAGAEIVDRAEHDDVAHIVIASHRRGVLARVVLGSVAERVVRTAKCPVTVVRYAHSEEE
jgi:nucleotide-binding universal stress UspA family protein